MTLESAEEGGFTSQIAGFPGAISEGKIEEEAIAVALEALREMLAFGQTLSL